MKSMSGVLGAVLALVVLGGCSYFRHERSIEPPEGCRRCHAEPIRGNWHVLFKPPAVHDELDSGSSVTSFDEGDAGSRESSACFVCHHTTDGSHLLYKGNYDH